MNPLTMLKLYRKASRVAGLLRQASRAQGESRMDPHTKSLFASKTFWFNLLTGIAELLQVVSGAQLLPPGWMAIAAAVVNIALRLVTDSGVHVAPPQP